MLLFLRVMVFTVGGLWVVQGSALNYESASQLLHPNAYRGWQPAWETFEARCIEGAPPGAHGPYDEYRTCAEATSNLAGVALQAIRHLLSFVFLMAASVLLVVQLSPKFWKQILEDPEGKTSEVK